MAGHGGKRPGAGRKPGPQAVRRLTVRLDKQRQQLAAEIEKVEAEDGISIWQRLVELTKNPDPLISLAALQLTAKHTLPVPQQKANLAHLTLPQIKTTKDAADALLQLSAAGAAGLIEPAQLKEVSTSIARAVECLNQTYIERDIELLKKENAELRKLNNRGQKAVAFNYEVVSGFGAFDEDPGNHENHINGETPQ